MMINQMAVRTGVVYGALLLMVGVMLPFLPVWLAARGFSIADVAFALACQSVVRVVAMPIITFVADKYRARRRFIILLAVLSAGFMAAAALVHGTIAITALIVLSALAWAPIMPMLDAVAVEQSEVGLYDYGRVRIAGSVTFIVGSLGAGALLSVMDAGKLGWVLVATHVLLALSGFALPKLGAAKTAIRHLSLASARKVLLTGGFALLIIVAGLTQASHAVYYGFGSLHWETQGYSGVTIGALWSIGVIAEIFLFLYARGSVQRMGPVVLLMAGSGLGAFRWAAMALDPPFAMVVVLQILHAASYGMTHLGTIYYVRRFMDADYAGTAQGLFGAISGGVIMTGAIALAGWAYGAGAGQAYLYMAAMCVVSLLLTFGLRRLGSAP
jgi:PPP family 3-phenylpropionic acid transporter